MKTKTPYLILAGILGTALASHGATTLTYSLNTANVDDGALDEATEMFTQSVTNFNGTDATFDIVITAVASGGNWNTDAISGMGVTGGALDTRVDSAGEDGAFTVSIANFNAGTSGLTTANVDFGFTSLRLSGAAGGGDSGTFSTLNGAAPSSVLTWTDGNAGSDFTGHLGSDSIFDLQLMNDNFGSGNRLTSLDHDHPGGTGNAWRYINLAVEFDFIPVPEPSSTALLGLGGLALVLRRKRS